MAILSSLCILLLQKDLTRDSTASRTGGVEREEKVEAETPCFANAPRSVVLSLQLNLRATVSKRWKNCKLR